MTTICSSNRDLHESIQKWILAWMQERSPDCHIDIDQDYYNAGLVDSFGLIELIEGIEQKFRCRFDQQDFRDLNIRSIRGLAAIAAAKVPNGL